MENYIASARKYRPNLFSEVVGQESITTTLENAIKNNHLAQAFLFCGPRGVGKTTCARILAKVINTPDGQDPDPEEDFSFNIFELDAASNNSVDDIRSLTDQVRIPPQVGNFKVYIIDEAHMLSQSAFNAFLKTLEEPPPHAIFILATTEKHKIIPTILSRCQIFDFKRIEIKDIVAHLAGIAERESIEVEADALHLVAEKADGALRDALSIFDQIVSFSGSKLSYQDVIDNLNILDYEYYFRITDAIRKEDIAETLLAFDEILQQGFDGHNFVNGLGGHFRNLLVCKNEATLKLLEVGENARSKYWEQSRKLEEKWLLTALRLISKADIDYKTSKNQRLLVEICLMQLCSVNYSEKKKNNELKIEIIPPDEIIEKAETQRRSEERIEVLQSAQKPKASLPVEKEAVTEPRVEKVVEPDSKVSEEGVPELMAKVSPGPKKTYKPANIGGGLTGSISIQDALLQEEQADAQQEELEENVPAEAYTEDKLLELWDAFAEKMEDSGQHSFAVSMKKYKPKVDGINTIMLLDNQAQVNDFDKHKQDLLLYIREGLQNYKVNLTYSMDIEKSQKKFYTNKERFDRMAEINPHLLDFQKELNLDTDY